MEGNTLGLVTRTWHNLVLDDVLNMKIKRAEEAALTMRVIPRNRPCFWRRHKSIMMTSSGDDNGDSGLEGSGGCFIAAGNIRNGSARLQLPPFLTADQVRIRAIKFYVEDVD